MQLIQAFFREAPNRIQLFDYDGRTDGQPVYLGHAMRGTSQATGIFVLFKFTYNGSNLVTQIESTEGIWDLRSTYFT